MTEQVRIQRLATWGLRGVAALTVLGGVLASAAFWVLVWRTWSTAPWPTESLVASALLQVLFAIAVVVWAVLLWRRARMMAALVARDYPAITCFAVCMRLAGELAAILCVLFSLALSVASLTWADLFVGEVLARLQLQRDLLGPASYAMAGGLALMWPAAGLFAAGLMLFGAYLFAEALTAMLEYVRDVRRIRERLAAAAALDTEQGAARGHE